jgi:glycosyltransferase involved in cell wall biosynthesis
LTATRVCHITTVHPVDDHRIVYKECVSLREAGYDVTLIAPHPRDTSVAGVPVTALQVRARTRIERIVRHPQAAYRAALALDADLYHFHDPEFLPYGTRLARAGKRVVYDAHEDVPTQTRSKDWLRGPSRAPVAHAIARVEASCVARIDALVSPSRAALERLAPYQPRAVLVANYPRLEDVGVVAPWQSRTRAACYVGGISRVRGAHALVDAMAYADAELYLAGSISPPKLRRELERSAGWRRVRYAGRISPERVPELLGRARVGVLPLQPIPNYRVAYPVKLFEYLAAGLPVVATDVPLWRELLETHGCGICVPPDSPRQLAEAMTSLLDDDARARSMGERGRRAAERHYSWGSQADKLIALYGELLA